MAPYNNYPHRDTAGPGMKIAYNSNQKARSVPISDSGSIFMTFSKLGPLAIVLASLAGGTSAAVSGSAIIDLASFSQGISIIDADLNDGITPVLSFSDDYVNYTSWPSFGGATSANAHGNIPDSGSGWRQPSASAHGQFRISGPAIVTFRANYWLNANVNVAADDGSFAYSRAQLAAGMHSLNPGGISRDQQESYAATGIHPSDNKNGTLQISFSSAGADFYPHEDGHAYAYGFLDLNSDVTLYQATAAVPEPSAYLMLLAGLGVVGTAVRRSKR